MTISILFKNIKNLYSSIASLVYFNEACCKKLSDFENQNFNDTFNERIKNMETDINGNTFMYCLTYLTSEFLNALKTYVYGDLDKFREVYIDAEKKEALRSKYTFPITQSGAGGEVVTLSTTTAVTTTQSVPASLDHSTQIEFRSTIPHALAVLSAIDVLGFLIGKKIMHEKPKKTSSFS